MSRRLAAALAAAALGLAGAAAPVQSAAAGAAQGGGAGAPAPRGSGEADTGAATNTIGGATGATQQTTATDPNELVSPPTLDQPPSLHRLSANEAIAIADRLEDVRRERREHRGSFREAYLKGAAHWQVSYFTRAPRREIAQVLIDDASGTVLEHWTGPQVAWTMARGYPGAFGRKVNEPWIWIPLSILFVLPFIDFRRPLRWFHLDLLALSAFSISIAFFNDGNIDASVPLVYPPLAYLFVRMLCVAFVRDRRPRDGPFRMAVPTSWLAVGVVFLVAFRIGLNVGESNVIDVGYAGVIGAQRMLDGDPLYGEFPSDNERGDTYGPVVYEAYIPAVVLLGWSGRWDDLPAAHGAAIAFDLLAILMLFLIGRRVRGPALGIALAYAWVAYPFTIYASNTNTNDVLVAALVLLAVLVAERPVRAGAAAALAGLTKFAPLALAPVLALYHVERGRLARRLALFALGFVAAAGVVCLPLLREDLSTFYDRTIGFQASRGSPFSVWGLYGWTAAQHLVQAAAVVVVLAIALLGTGRRSLAALSAACAAVLIGLQLGVTHWFYLYIVWFFPLVMIAELCREGRAGGAARSPRPGEAGRRSAPALP